MEENETIKSAEESWEKYAVKYFPARKGWRRIFPETYDREYVRLAYCLGFASGGLNALREHRKAFEEIVRVKK